MNLSVIIPIYNEASSIPELIERIVSSCQEFTPYEIICIDDGSTDGTYHALMREKEIYEFLKIIRLRKNCGKSDALDAGFREAKGKFVVTLDADLQDHPEEIPHLLEAIEGYDVAIGWRHLRQDSILKKIASFLANRIRVFLLDDRSHDSACALKAFRDYTLKDLTMYKGMHRFFPALMRMKGFKEIEVKVSHSKRVYGESKYGTFSWGPKTFLDLLAVLWIRRRRMTYEIEEID